jgi:hypothetical protein
VSSSESNGQTLLAFLVCWGRALRPINQLLSTERISEMALSTNPNHGRDRFLFVYPNSPNPEQLGGSPVTPLSMACRCATTQFTWFPFLPRVPRIQNENEARGVPICQATATGCIYGDR